MSISVFEMAFRENANLANVDSDKLNAQKVASKALSESVIKSEAKTIKESIKLGKIRFTEDIDDIDIQPSEDVVVVYSDKITPEMSAEEVEKAAEELIGSTICKCGICGANYIADDNHKHTDDIEGEDEIEDSLLFTDDEDLGAVDVEDEEFKESLIFTEETVSDKINVDTDETEEIIDEESENIESDTICPVCNAEDTQVEVGIIAPNEESKEETEDDDKSDDSEETEETEDKDDTKTEETEETDDESDNEETKDDDSDVKEESINFKDRAFNILLNKFVRENYKNIKSIRIDEGRCEDGELVFEGVVNTFKGSTYPVTFKTVKYAYTEGVLKLRMTESGVFTESAEIKEGRVPFVLECAARNGYIVPRVLKCKYNVRESGKLFECFGKYTLSK